MVTSSLPGEGKSTVAGNLALAFSQLERVLLIDADLRRPAVADGFGLDPKGPGLADICAGTAPLVSCLQREVRKSVDVLTAGTLPPDPQKLLGSEKMQELLKTFKDEYDRIIIDCPPSLPVSDALLLAYHAEILIYVIKAETTSVSQIKAGLQKYKKTPATVIGTVLNQVDVKKLAAYGEYGGGYYGDYYAAAAPPST
jgi:capsular exopolysaccharide synthesis family protein